jgi:hypothetical protein
MTELDESSIKESQLRNFENTLLENGCFSEENFQTSFIGSF